MGSILSGVIILAIIILSVMIATKAKAEVPEEAPKEEEMNGNEKANRIQIANIPMPDADTEYPWALPKNCRSFVLHTRDGTAIRVAVEADLVADSHSPYFTVKANTSLSSDELKVEVKYGLKLFFACGSADKTIEAIMGVYDPELIVEEV